MKNLKVVVSEETGKWLFASSSPVPQEGERVLSASEQAEFHRSNPNEFPEFHRWKPAKRGEVTQRLSVVPTNIMNPRELKEFVDIENANNKGDESKILGFVNTNISNSEDGRGDGKWYEFGKGRVHHLGDEVMTKEQALSEGIEIGKQ